VITPVNWATSGVVKIERAVKHIRDLEAQVRAFQETDPYTIIRKDDPDTGELVVFAGIPKPLPPPWGAIAGDAIHNLRSSLDLLWRQVNCPNTLSPLTPSEAFKVYDSPDLLDAALAREKKPTRKAAMNILKEIESFKGGNYLLCLLDTINDIDKHRVLIPAYNSVHAVRFWTESATPLPGSFPRQVHIQKLKPLYPVHDGTELWRTIVPPGEMYVNLEFLFSVTLGEVDIISGKDIVTTLDQITSVVEGIAETFRIRGLLR